MRVAADKTSDFSRSVTLYRMLSSVTMAAMGAFYVFAGALCFGQAGIPAIVLHFVPDFVFPFVLRVPISRPPTRSRAG